MTPVRPRAAVRGRYTISETARLLDVSRMTVYRWLEEGTLRASIQRKTLRKYISGAEILRVWDSDWIRL